MLDEIAKRGSFEKRDTAAGAIPAHAARVLQDPGPGPQGHRAGLSSTIKVATIDELERICQEQKLRELPRMGAKLEEKVLKSIAQYRQRTGRFLLSFGQKAAAN